MRQLQDIVYSFYRIVKEIKLPFNGVESLYFPIFTAGSNTTFPDRFILRNTNGLVYSLGGEPGRYNPEIKEYRCTSPTRVKWLNLSSMVFTLTDMYEKYNKQILIANKPSLRDQIQEKALVWELLAMTAVNDDDVGFWKKMSVYILGTEKYEFLTEENILSLAYKWINSPDILGKIEELNQRNLLFLIKGVCFLIFEEDIPSFNQILTESKCNFNTKIQNAVSIIASINSDDICEISLGDFFQALIPLADENAKRGV